MVDNQSDKSVGKMCVEVVLAMPKVQYRIEVIADLGASARQLVRLALEHGLLPQKAVVDVEPAIAALGVFGERVDDNHVCQDGDRIEIYRPLQQDPKELRRQRAQQKTIPGQVKGF